MFELYYYFRLFKFNTEINENYNKTSPLGTLNVLRDNDYLSLLYLIKIAVWFVELIVGVICYLVVSTNIKLI